MSVRGWRNKPDYRASASTFNPFARAPGHTRPGVGFPDASAAARICSRRGEKRLVTKNHAQQFLNEIKSIFNLDHCYYLISDSENAINSFERRGLPFRDAFDSALDTILYVDYLDLEQGKRLIYRRVIGLARPSRSTPRSPSPSSTRCGPITACAWIRAEPARRTSFARRAAPFS